MLALFRLLMFLFVMETAPAEEEEATDDEGDEEEESEETEGADEEEEAEAEEEIRDPLAKLRAEVEKKERFARQLKVAQEELAIATKKLEEEPVVALRGSRVQAAFLRAVIDRGERYDLEAMWDLATARGFFDTVDVTDDGDVEGMEDALGRVLDRYPWLREDVPITEERILPGQRKRTAPPPKKRKDSTVAQHTDASMKDRFPALRKAGR